MGVETEKYIRKPLYVDAVRVSTQNFDEIASWCQGEVQVDAETRKQYIKVRVHLPKVPRQTRAYPGDWILYTDKGYKVYTNRAFRASFDKVVDEGVVTPATPIEEPTTPQGEPIEIVEATPQAIADVVNEQQPKEPGLQAAALEGGHPIDPEEPIAPPPTPAITPPTEDTRLQTETDEGGKLKHEPVPDRSHNGGTEGDGTDEQPSEIITEEHEPRKSHKEPPTDKRVLTRQEQAEMGPEAVRDMLREGRGDVVLEQDLEAA